MTIYISIGGRCATAVSLRKDLNLTSYALPFDYIRSNFKCIVNSIKYKFKDFFPILNKKDIGFFVEKHLYEDNYDHFIDELQINKYFLENHSFWHYNLNNLNVISSFNRRFDF
jgi:hypothetical protein